MGIWHRWFPSSIRTLRIQPAIVASLVSVLQSRSRSYSFFSRCLAAASPSSSLSLHIIREEQQLLSPMQARLREPSSSSSSSEALSTLSDDMDFDVHSPPVSVSNTVMRPINRRAYYHHKLPFYHCHPKSLFAQHLAIPSNTAYLPWAMLGVNLVFILSKEHAVPVGLLAVFSSLVCV